MKKLIIFLTVFFLAFTTNIFAQSDNVAVTAELLDELSITKNNDLAFGNVSINTTATVAADGATSGKLTINGSNSATVIVTAPQTLNITGPGDPIEDTNSYLGNNEDNQSGASVGNLGGGGGEVTLNATSGNFFVWIGGTFTTTSAQVTGSYSGTLTIEVQYI